MRGQIVVNHEDNRLANECIQNEKQMAPNAKNDANNASRGPIVNANMTSEKWLKFEK